MQNTLYPSDILRYTSEQVLSRHSSKGHFIYLAAVVGVLTALILLPILNVSVSIQGNGIIRPTTEKNSVKLLVSGTVSEIFISENDKVKKNQEILALDTSILDKRLKFVEYEEEEHEKSIHDLKLLVSVSPGFPIEPNLFKTTNYRSDYLLLVNKIKEISYNREKAKKELERYRLLNKNDLASKSDLEHKELEERRLSIQYEMVIDEHKGKWHRELFKSQTRLKELNAQKQQILKEKELSVIKSSVSGTVEQFTGISTGSYLQAGQAVAVISPDGDIVAEVYIIPHDIGLIKIGTKAKIQVDAFNYNQWGLINGTVTNISDDYIPIDNQPFFKVRCKMDKNYLKLKNGYKGYLKKGMTVRTRFLITRRTLFQLLYDKIDDWVNPIQKN